jgi:serine O-acetyltransferase
MLHGPRARPAPITWKETLERLRQDRGRLRLLIEEEGGIVPRPLLLHPSYLCVWLHRLSHFFQDRGRTRLARVFWQLDALLTGADIQPRADIGGGLVIPNPAAISLAGRAGRNLTVMALAGTGELDRSRDIGAGPGLPLLGDDVVLSPHSGVLGAVRIGDRVILQPGCVVSQPVPDDAVVEAAAPRFVKRRPVGETGP